MNLRLKRESSMSPDAIVLSKRRSLKRSGAVFLILILATAMVVMGFTQTALRGVLAERKSVAQSHLQRQLHAAIDCTLNSGSAAEMKPIILPVNDLSNERIEVIRNGTTITARWMAEGTERASLTRIKPAETES